MAVIVSGSGRLSEQGGVAACSVNGWLETAKCHKSPTSFLKRFEMI
jgi:hypothetical protein